MKNIFCTEYNNEKGKGLLNYIDQQNMFMKQALAYFNPIYTNPLRIK